MLLRILASLILLISLLFLPFWLSVLLALLAMAYFNLYWEGVVLFFLSDLLYGVGEARFRGVFFLSAVVSSLMLLVIELAKKKIRVRNQI